MEDQSSAPSTSVNDPVGARNNTYALDAGQTGTLRSLGVAMYDVGTIGVIAGGVMLLSAGMSLNTGRGGWLLLVAAVALLLLSDRAVKTGGRLRKAAAKDAATVVDVMAVLGEMARLWRGLRLLLMLPLVLGIILVLLSFLGDLIPSGQ